MIVEANKRLIHLFFLSNMSYNPLNLLNHDNFEKKTWFYIYKLVLNLSVAPRLVLAAKSLQEEQDKRIEVTFAAEIVEDSFVIVNCVGLL